ncbi:hypothetical protein E4U23_005279 [Claviceps purpurea]|nr:hypothetical protein E4U23_005279 [Claviceps purpurea]
MGRRPEIAHPRYGEPPSKDLAIAIEFTKHEYAWMDREGGAVNATTASTRDRRYIDCRRMARIEGLRD